MPVNSDYKIVSTGPWRLALLPETWSRELEKAVFEVVNAQPWSKHPQTLTVRLRQGRAENEFFLKVFHASYGWAAFKDIFRLSGAFRAWRQGLALSGAGFDVPVTIAAGEERRCRFLRRAFILTRKLHGQPAHLFLRRLIDRAQPDILSNVKRAGLRRVAELVRRFHQQGFIHGDLVASNIFVADDGKEGAIFYLMDNDRTHRYPSWLPQSLWKRNLIQLNRMPLPGITLQDRMRFFRAYLGSQKLTTSERGLACWLERETRRRRKECDGVDPTGDFRRLMRWSREVSPSSNPGKVG
jgi:hypothetical protein